MNENKRVRKSAHTSSRPEILPFTLNDEGRQVWDAVVTDAIDTIRAYGDSYSGIVNDLLHMKQLPACWFADEAPAYARQLSIALAQNGDQEFNEMFSMFPAIREFVNELFMMTAERYASNEHLAAQHSCVLLQIREVLGLFARLTRESDGAQECLQKAVKRLTAEPECQLPDSLPFVGEVLLKDFELDYLQQLGEPCCWLPKHGPGSCAEFPEWGIPGRHSPKELAFKHAWKESYRWKNDPMRSWLREDWFRPIFAVPNVGIAQYSQLYEEQPAMQASRLAAVPKDYRGPRIIAMEPVLHQYIQQSVFARFMAFLPFSPLGRVVRLDRADLNSRDALRSSVTRMLATLDLSDASDYVRTWHIEALTRRLPTLRRYLFSLRTGSVSLGNESYRITTFAPMGSALCPPMQSAFYAALLISAYWDQQCRGAIVTAGGVLKAIGKLKLRCYNDDIIINTEYSDLGINALERAGLIPNRQKCCIRGFFRESCGMDAYYGHDVTPIRPRELPGATSVSLNGLLDTCSNLYKKGFIRACFTLMKLVQEHVVKHGAKSWKYLIPVLLTEERLPGTVTLPDAPLVLQQHRGLFWDKNLQRLALRTCVEKPVLLRVDPLNRALRDALARNHVSERGFEGYASGRRRIVTTTLLVPGVAYECTSDTLAELLRSSTCVRVSTEL